MRDADTIGCLVWVACFSICIAIGGFCGWPWGFVAFAVFIIGLIVVATTF